MTTQYADILVINVIIADVGFVGIALIHMNITTKPMNIMMNAHDVNPLKLWEYKKKGEKIK